jgi:uncharacterized protein (DUF58 family)
VSTTENPAPEHDVANYGVANHGAPNQGAAAWLPGWTLSGAIPAAAVVAVVFSAAGLVFSRVDIVLIALPLIVCVALAWERRPQADAPSSITAEVHGGDGKEGGQEAGQHPGMLRYTIDIETPDAAESVQVRLATLSGAGSEYTITSATASAISGRVPIIHSGPQELLSAQYRLIGHDGAFFSSISRLFPVRRTVAPSFSPIDSLPLPPVLHGLTGTHNSSRPGDGGEFRDIHPFTPGDRLRRIDWKATARRAQTPGELYVRRTTATAEATVLLVVDSRDDVGENVASWSTGSWGNASSALRGETSMDIARSAASSIAAGYIRAGDRVGFQDLASSARVIQHGGGSRHLARVLRAIELTGPSGPPLYRVRAPMVVPGALIYVLSTFLDDEAGRMATLWRAAGHRVIAVDVLPPAKLNRLPKEEVLAHRIIMMERADRIRSLSSYGIEVFAWEHAGRSATLAAVLRTMSRQGARR